MAGIQTAEVWPNQDQAKHWARVPLTPPPAHANIPEQGRILCVICQGDSYAIKGKKNATLGSLSVSSYVLLFLSLKVRLRRSTGERPLWQH